MDSLSQAALGAAIGAAVMGRRTAVWKAALWGGVAGTLRDLDALVDYGDALRNMTFHRAASHSLLYLTLLAPVLAWGVSRIHGEALLFPRWSLALWLALFTHPWLDWLTIYGTQLFIPFSNHPAGLGSLFIIDPLYTLPLVLGLAGTAVARSAARWRWNSIGLTVSCVYVLWSAAAQAYVHRLAVGHLRAQDITTSQVLTTATPFNTVLWRVVAMTPDGHFVEGFRSVAEGAGGAIRWDRFDAGRALAESLRGSWNFERMAWFTGGLYRLRHEGDAAVLDDLRMGQEPYYAFAFTLAERDRATGGAWREVRPMAVGSSGDVRAGLAWIWARMWDATIPPTSSRPR